MPFRKHTKIDWFNTGFMLFFTVAAIVATALHISIEGFNPWLWIPFIALYMLSGLSITGGYHRLFAHRSYRANKWIKLLYLIFGAAAFENSALRWCSDHRRHHTHCDTERDPYNIAEGFWHAHMGWILTRDKYPQLSQRYDKDLRRDPLVMWQHKYYLPIAITSGLVLPTLIGIGMGSPIGGLAFAGLARVVFVHHMTFFINSLCHVLGGQPFTDTNTARDSWIAALFTYGEGYHNFHHYFQSDYRNGIRWFDFDPTKWLINGLHAVGLADKLTVTPQEEIERAKLIMDQKRLSQLTNAEQKNRFRLLSDSLSDKLEAMQALEAQFRNARGSELVELKRKMKELRRQFHSELANWQIFKREILMAA